MIIQNSLVNYNLTFDKGPSEKNTASLERTVHNVPYSTIF